jgi:hypothetical protein
MPLNFASWFAQTDAEDTQTDRQTDSKVTS